MCTPKPMHTLYETQRIHNRIFLKCALKKAFLSKAQVGILLLAYSNMGSYSGAPEAWDIFSGYINQ